MADTKTTRSVVAQVGDLDEGAMKMAKVGEQRVVIIRTASGYHALDNACPHQGYGLVTGSLDGELLTCQWHNWKFRVSDGCAVIGEENVACHRVAIDGDDIVVEVDTPSVEQRRTRLWPSLHSGLEKNYAGQIARDATRLLHIDTPARDIVAAGLTFGLPRTEWGVGHEMANAADCLTIVERFDGLDQAHPVVAALVGFAETARGRQPRDLPAAPATVEVSRDAFLEAIETEDWPAAAHAVLASRAAGDGLATLREWFIAAAAAHHIGYGHGAIYVQKSFELVDQIDDDETIAVLLVELALSLISMTREDTLPYMRRAIRDIEAVDLDALAAATHRPDRQAEQQLARTILDGKEAAIAEATDAALEGRGVEGLLNAVTLAASQRLLSYDIAIESDSAEGFGWLDITHSLTYANAARWAWHHHPGPETARLALLTVWLAHDTGRYERRTEVLPGDPETVPTTATLADAIQRGRPGEAVAHARAGTAEAVADQLIRLSVGDGAGSFIVAAHMVKMAVAAEREAAATGSHEPLAATARFMAAPRQERFVAQGVAAAIDFVETGRPPVR